MKKMYKKPIVETCKTESLMQSIGVSTVDDANYGGGGNAPARRDASPLNN